MNDPLPLRSFQSGAEARAGQALEALCQQHRFGRERRIAVGWAISSRVLRRRRPRALWLVSGAAAAAAAAMLLALPHSPTLSDTVPPSPKADEQATWDRLELAQIGTVEVSPSAAFEVREVGPEKQLRLSSGTLRAHVVQQESSRPVVVVTPHVRVVVVGTRFDVRAEDHRTVVQVLEGRVRVESPASSISVQAGETVDSQDARLLAPPPAPAPEAAPAPTARASARPPPPAGCPADLPPAQRASCLKALSGGQGLAAQNALFTLALMARDENPEEALEHFAAYERRFPTGALASEVGLRKLDLLRSMGRTWDAARAAESFERRFASDPRAMDVRLLRAELLCAAGALDQASALLEGLTQSAEPELRERAARQLRACAGRPDAAE